MTVYHNDWSETGEKGMLDDFQIDRSVINGCDVLAASYTQEGYEGYAYVLFRKDGKLFEVHGSHCSCYGLEDQWQSEETTKESILHRLDKGTWGEEDRIKDIVRAAINKE